MPSSVTNQNIKNTGKKRQVIKKGDSLFRRLICLDNFCASGGASVGCDNLIWSCWVFIS